MSKNKLKERILQVVNEEIGILDNMNDNNYKELILRVNPEKEEFFNELKNSKYKILRGWIASGNIFVWDAFYGNHEQVYDYRIKGSYGLISNTKFDAETLEARFYIKDEDNGEYVIELDKFTDNQKSKPCLLTNEQVEEIFKELLGKPVQVEEGSDYNYFVYQINEDNLKRS